MTHFQSQRQPSFPRFHPIVSPLPAVVLSLVAALLFSKAAHSQSIIPAADGTATLVTRDGQRYIIDGGSLSGDGTNLFHSFQDFGLSLGESADFLAHPQLQNILGRVTGGTASIIDGLIQVTGGSPNLYLMNPAGFVFGNNASLNIPAAFTATTADRIGFGDGFGDGQWFDAFGSNNFKTLVGTPNQFAFTASQPGSIINASDLTVAPDQNLTLLGGTIVNTGSLTAPSGILTIVAVPGESLVRISQEGMLLNLEINPLENQPASYTPHPAPLSLPELLTQANLTQSTGATVDASGTVVLTGSGLPLAAGDVAMSGHRLAAGSPPSVRAGTATLSANGHLTLVQSQLQTTGDLNLFARNTVQIRDSATTPFSAIAGGNLILQGNQGIDILALNHLPGKPFQSGGDLSLISDGIISTDAHFSSGGNFSLRTLKGEIANFRSLYDPIVDVGGDFAVGDYTGASLQVTAGGNITYGTVVINAIDPAVHPTNPAFFLNAGGMINGQGDVSESLAGEFLVDFQAVGDINTQGIITNGGLINLNSTAGSVIANSKLDTTFKGFSSGDAGDIQLSALGDITTGDLEANGSVDGGDITLEAGNRIITGTISSASAATGAAIIGGGDGGDVMLTASGDIEVVYIDARGTSVGSNDGIGGDVDSTTDGFFRVTGSFPFTTSSGVATSISTEGTVGNGSITIRYRSGASGTPFSIGDGAMNGTAAAITSGSFTLVPPESLSGEFVLGNIQILDRDSTASTIPTVDPVDLLQPDPYSPLFVRKIPPLEVDTIAEVDEFFTQTLEAYLEFSNTPIKTLADARSILGGLEQEAGIKPALIYAVFTPRGIGGDGPPSDGTKSLDSERFSPANPGTKVIWRFVSQGISASGDSWLQLNREPQADDQLELILVTAKGRVIRRSAPGASRAAVRQGSRQFSEQVIRAGNMGSLVAAGRTLYQWLVAPLEDELQAREINNLVFILDERLRSVPLAAMHDRQGFIVERYSVGLMPSLSLTDTRYVDLKNFRVLAMGASEFVGESPLPAVPMEVSVIANGLWQGSSFLNEGFTPERLLEIRQSTPFAMIHLATHASFRPGKPDNSYIRFWDRALPFDRIRQLQLYDPLTELLVLSACETAVGDPEAELGFSGLAVQTGVKSALGSLWQVNDVGTLGLMTSFYEQLKQSSTKSEALRRAQLAMLQGKVRIQDGQLVTDLGAFPLPPSLQSTGNIALSHPYYWSAFTLVGNPW